MIFNEQAVSGHVHNWPLWYSGRVITESLELVTSSFQPTREPSWSTTYQISVVTSVCTSCVGSGAVGFLGNGQFSIAVHTSFPNTGLMCSGTVNEISVTMQWDNVVYSEFWPFQVFIIWYIVNKMINMVISLHAYINGTGNIENITGANNCSGFGFGTPSITSGTPLTSQPSCIRLGDQYQIRGNGTFNISRLMGALYCNVTLQRA